MMKLLLVDFWLNGTMASEEDVSSGTELYEGCGLTCRDDDML